MAQQTMKVFCAIIFFHACCVVYVESCDVRARTETGSVCGRIRSTEERRSYASFRGIPYAKQPLGELRFKELQPAEPWEDEYEAFEEGPRCPQEDLFYGVLIEPQGLSEACIHANIHVPIGDLPTTKAGTSPNIIDIKPANTGSGVPVVVFVHGGGFACGSGDADAQGPEYLVNKGVIVVTFNYRLSAIGFLSLNSSSIPGNNGLRDQITLLRWVQRNVGYFGGNPDDVTLAGQSAGSASAHLLSISPATDGLFKRVMLMSGAAFGGFYSTSPEYARDKANQFLAGLGIESTDPEEIHRQLIDVPIEKILEVTTELEKTNVLSVFVPVVEHPHPGVTIVLDDDPEVLVRNGRGRDLPLIIGVTSNECAVFQTRFETIDILNLIDEDPTYILAPSLNYTTSPVDKLSVITDIVAEYLNRELTMDGWINICSDSYFLYPALKNAQLRAANGGAPVYLYQFSYEAQISLFRIGGGISYEGATHLEDLSYVLRLNSIFRYLPNLYPIKTRDIRMKDWMVDIVVNFATCGNPTCNEDSNSWPPLDGTTLKYQDINYPEEYSYVEPTDKQLKAIQFFDNLYNNNKK